MKKIVNKILLARHKFMPERDLWQPGFTCSACEPFTKNKERIQKCKEIGDSLYIYPNKLDKASFQNDMAYGDFKDLTRKTASQNILHDTAFNMMYINAVLHQWFINFLIKKLLVNIENYNISNKTLTGNYTNQLLESFRKKTKVHLSFTTNIWNDDLVTMQLISKLNIGFRFPLCIIYIFSKYAWAIPLKDKKEILLLMLFKKF